MAAFSFFALPTSDAALAADGSGSGFHFGPEAQNLHVTVRKFVFEASWISPHNSAGIMSLMSCWIFELSPAPNEMFAQSEFKLFQIDRLTRSYGI